MLEYSIDSRLNQRVFVSHRNDIAIYTEDNPDKKEFYTVVFQRLFDKGEVKITDIHPLGPKRDVIAQCKKWNHPKSSEDGTNKKAIFIVDADLELIYDGNEQADNLFALKIFFLTKPLFASSYMMSVLRLR